MLIANASGVGGGIFLVFVVAAIIGVLWLSQYLSEYLDRSRSRLDAWAAEHGYRILSAERRHLARGPFFLDIRSKGQAVFRVEIEDRAGRRRTGYVRCGIWPGEFLSREVEMRWDD